MTIQIIACIAFFILAAFFGFRIVNRGRGALLASLCLYSFLFYFLFKDFQISLFISILNLHLILLILSLEDIAKQYLLLWHFVFLFLAVILVRIYMDIPVIVNLISVIMAFILFFIPHIITRGKGLGIGDVIVFPVLAILMTPVEMILLFLFTLLGATLFALLQRLITQKSSRFPLVPFMQLGLLLMVPLREFWISLFHLQNIYLMQFL